MFYDAVFLIILFTLIYSYISSRNQYSETASAIRQIWSGSCRLSCRHSGHSGISGLSGLPGPPVYLGQYPANPSSIEHGQVEALGNIAGPSSNCNCQSCPCALIDNVLRSCQPATDIYSEILDGTVNLLSLFLQRLEDAYSYVMRVFECNASCQRHAQLVTTRDYQESQENFSFERGDKENPLYKIKSATNENSQENKSSENLEKSKKLNGDAVRKEHSSDNFKAEKNVCPKCTEKGKVCINECPKQNDTAVPAKNSASEPAQQVGTSKDIPDLKNIDNDVPKKLKAANTPKIQEGSNESMADKGFCPKCIQKGKPCLKKCPKAIFKAQKE